MSPRDQLSKATTLYKDILQYIYKDIYLYKDICNRDLAPH